MNPGGILSFIVFPNSEDGTEKQIKYYLYCRVMNEVGSFNKELKKSQGETA